MSADGNRKMSTFCCYQQQPSSINRQILKLSWNILFAIVIKLQKLIFIVLCKPLLLVSCYWWHLPGLILSLNICWSLVRGKYFVKVFLLLYILQGLPWLKWVWACARHSTELIFIMVFKDILYMQILSFYQIFNREIASINFLNFLHVYMKYCASIGTEKNYLQEFEKLLLCNKMHI